MKKRKLYFATIFAVTAVLTNSNCYANAVEEKFIKAGLVNIHDVDKSIKVDLVNSDKNKNYFRKDFYNGLAKAYLRKEVAEKLMKAQKLLKVKFPRYSIQIMDAARPRSVSQHMYDQMKGTSFEKFVANPDKGSMHNYGIAVDVTIVDGEGREIDMGFTPFYKGNSSIYIGYTRMKMFGLTAAQTKNRTLLSRTMKQAGFLPLSYEWWHFNGMPKGEARSKYQIIE